MYISVASTASYYAILKGYDLTNSDQYVDHWNMMTYDYWVSDIPGASITAPN